MSQVAATIISGNLIRLVMVLVAVVVFGAAVLNRSRLGTATIPAVLGAGLYTIGNTIAILAYSWQVVAVQSRHEEVQHVATVVTFTTYVTQSCATLSVALLGYAIVAGRRSGAGDV
jgi:hypothetical protein